MSLDELEKLGCNVEEGVTRCMGNSDFYLKMVDRFIADEERVRALGDALAGGDNDAAFELAHALKGVCANLALTPLEAKIGELTELLRARAEGDHTCLYNDFSALFYRMKDNG